MKMRGIPGFRDFALAPQAILDSLVAMRLLDRKRAAVRLATPPDREGNVTAKPVGVR